MKNLVTVFSAVILMTILSTPSEARHRHHRYVSAHFNPDLYHHDYNFELSPVGYHSPVREFNYFDYQAYNGS